MSKGISTVWSLDDELKDFDLGESRAYVAEWLGSKALHFNESGAAVFLNNDMGLKAFRLQAKVAIPEAGFIGLVFGARNSENYELIYLSHGNREGVGEIQYDPVMNGSTTWQIYQGPIYQAAVPYKLEEWVKLTLEIQQNTVSIYVGEALIPQLVISNLQHGLVSGKIGIWGYAPTYIRNLSIEEIQAEERIEEPILIEKLKANGFVTDWLVSQPYHEITQINDQNWVSTVVEENGTLNINRLHPSSKDISVQIKSTVYIMDAMESTISCGFSDQLRLWINGEEVYQGVWKWNPPRSDGRIRSDYVSIPVSWKAGLNTILAEVTNQEVIFGWGLSLIANI